MKLRPTILVIVTLSSLFICDCSIRKDRYSEKNEITLSTIESFKNDAIRKFRRYNLLYTRKRSIKKTIKWAQEQNIIKGASLKKDNTICVIFKNQVEIDIIIQR